MRRGWAILLIIACGWSAALPGRVEAQSAAEAADRALQTGAYPEARQQYRSLFEAAGRRGTDYAVAYAETFLAVGAYADGLREIEAALRQAPNDPYLRHAQGRLLAAVGRYQEAEEAFRRAATQPDFWRNTLAWARLLQGQGRTREAFDLYARIAQPYEQGVFRTAEALGVAAQALAALEAFHDANNAFRTAHQLDPARVWNLYGWAELFRQKYNIADAQRTYEEALRLNPRHAPSYVGLARTMNNFGRQEELARKALDINPASTDALDLLAELRILDGLYDEAEQLLQQALDINPASISTLAHLAAVQYLREDAAAFAEVETRARAVNPRAAAFYVTLAEDVSRRYRYPAAVAFARQAVEADPRDVAALAALGTNLLRAGAFQEARRYLAASFDRDPFNLFVGNTLTLLDEYEDFAMLDSEHFRLLIHSAERDILGPQMLAEAEKAYAAFQARYPYVPAGKILIEAYNDRDDFAVRVAGVPHVGLLGVSFGDVVALNTPRAQAGQPYNWARTLWHELAHTMAIGVSDFHVPRWFTEGLSVYEEQRARPEWGREMDLQLFYALDAGKLLPLEALDRGFTRPAFPGQVLLSYYHASKVIGFLVDQYGFEAITGILTRLREGHTMAESIEQVVGQDIAAVDQAFLADLRQQRAAYARVLAGLPDLLGEAEAVLPQGGEGNPFLARMEAGNAALQAGSDAAAEAAFKEALDLYADYTGPGNPYLGLAEVYRRRGDEDRLIDILERYLRRAEHGAEAARELAALYLDRGAAAKALPYLHRSLEVDPYDLPTREQLAQLHEQQRQYGETVTERRAVLALDPVDRAQALYQLAASLYLNGEVPAAKRAVLRALELAPGFRDAQQLLLKCVEAS